ncbi:MAG: hypothetical protein V1492_03130 [Candidatus Micrarchaeota archaeon]
MQINKNFLLIGIALLAVLAVLLITQMAKPAEQDSPIKVYRLNDHAMGYSELKNHTYNMGVVSNDKNDLRAEYEAGFVQGKLQKDLVALTRDNEWDSAALTDASPYKKIPPTQSQKEQAAELLLQNYNYTLNYAKNADPVLRQKILRVVFRMLGVYHGATKDSPANLDFSGNWTPGPDYFTADELKVNYETSGVSFMDIYFLNAVEDVFDVIDNQEGQNTTNNPSKCSAFIKRTANETFLAHNSWSSFLDQSMVLTYYINGNYLTFNAISPGTVTSLSDFGYNDKGIFFIETTHHDTYTEPKVDALWMFMRAALAEQFAGSLDEFYNLVSLEASGTYMNGYMIYDDKTKDIGLVEMSYKSFAYFKSAPGKDYVIETKPENLSKAYDPELVQQDVILGVNFPASLAIREELKAIETRPARRAQFLAGMGAVNDIESAKALITYTAPNEPLSIYGRWDLGFGNTTAPKTVPDGSIDAKAATASMMKQAYNLKGEMDLKSPQPAFWMKYGTPVFNGKPFIWSESNWSSQKLRWVPDSVSGEYMFVNSYIQ